MSRKPTVVEAWQVQPGMPTSIDPVLHVVGAVAMDGKLFIVTARFDPGPEAPAPEAAKPTKRKAEEKEINA